ncbi:maleylpyruvate isomerase family mycothiol-dependent enzyme [Kutzneria sp. CA-103260]|uniref:maleylpyruvate isomerase family mycothiol-dependent enzyme n=1 Tax=Kutzneria sp. CA-103260 TaxID=2802641 RepID=UPI001BA7091C|nr:maleylpyruvate isomerase family mycothiol-dependent enzyme [Kutzneria sp. CA-103260]QUQ68596.1 maleylpyruvate isomerase family mycothiol-dependent enzyme [Kutzneria sp. CA-103260]
MTLLELARQERTDLAEFLATLSPDEWDAPSLCAGWRVRDVVAHMISYDELDTRALFDRLVRGAFGVHRSNAIGVEDLGRLSPDELLAMLRRHLTPQGLTSWFGGLVGLEDCLIHHQDIRRALGRPRQVPADRLRPCLRTAVLNPIVGGPWRIRGLRVTATDLGWSFGFGPEVAGPAEPLLMAITGRRGVVGELSGPGVATLTARIER